jgi:AhpD family alkylhydroperoxidase
MTPRLNIFQSAPEGTKAMIEVEKSIASSGLEHSLLELVRIRASQINGCAFCLHMHVTEAIRNGEDGLRLQLLDGWRDSPSFTDRERAALNWTESLTRVSKTHAPDADFALLKSEFSDIEIAYLTLTIAQINAWNRIQISLRAVHPATIPVSAAA